MSEYVLELKGITKIFPGVRALDKVQFQLKPGEIHALMGENGAGKSTFIKVITGVHQAEEGEIFLDGRKVTFRSPLDAQKAGIAAIYQHATAYPHLTVAENIFMGHEKMRRGMIDWKAMNRASRELLDTLSAEFGPEDLMGSLSVAQQQMVEIAHALSVNARILIMDEPTAALTKAESEKLYEITERLRDMTASSSPNAWALSMIFFSFLPLIPFLPSIYLSRSEGPFPSTTPSWRDTKNWLIPGSPCLPARPLA